jgi:hypothetical protein
MAAEVPGKSIRWSGRCDRRVCQCERRIPGRRCWPTNQLQNPIQYHSLKKIISFEIVDKSKMEFKIKLKRISTRYSGEQTKNFTAVDSDEPTAVLLSSLWLLFKHTHIISSVNNLPMHSNKVFLSMVKNLLLKKCWHCFLKNVLR